VAERSFGFGILHDDDSPTLTITTTWGEACVVENSIQSVVWKLVVGEVAGSESGTHNVIQFHLFILPRVARSMLEDYGAQLFN
jgi:hypothetical protein